MVVCRDTLEPSTPSRPFSALVTGVFCCSLFLTIRRGVLSGIHSSLKLPREVNSSCGSGSPREKLPCFPCCDRLGSQAPRSCGPPARGLSAQTQGLVAEPHISMDLFKLCWPQEAEKQTDHFQTPNILPLVGGRAGWINSTCSWLEGWV